MTIRANQVEGGIKKATNGRYYVRLKAGGSKFISDDDAKRLRAQLGASKANRKPAASTTAKKKKPAAKAKAKKKPAAKKKTTKTTRRTKRHLADLL